MQNGDFKVEGVLVAVSATLVYIFVPLSTFQQPSGLASVSNAVMTKLGVCQ